MSKLQELENEILNISPEFFKEKKRDINLEDVLKAIHKVKRDFFDMRVDSRSDEFSIKKELGELLVLWEFGKPLHKQRIGRIVYLYKLLVLKK